VLELLKAPLFRRRVPSQYSMDCSGGANSSMRETKVFLFSRKASNESMLSDRGLGGVSPLWGLLYLSHDAQCPVRLSFVVPSLTLAALTRCTSFSRAIWWYAGPVSWIRSRAVGDSIKELFKGSREVLVSVKDEIPLCAPEPRGGRASCGKPWVSDRIRMIEAMGSG